jgi:hypothetical protein
MIFTRSELSGGLQMADSVVEMGDDKFMTLLLQNHRTKKLYLKRGMQLGVASAAEVLTSRGMGTITTAECRSLSQKGR